MLQEVAHNQHCVNVTNRATGQYGIAVCDPNTVVSNNENWTIPELFGDNPLIENGAFNGNQVLKLREGPDDQTVDLSTSTVIMICDVAYVDITSMESDFVGTTQSPIKNR